MTAPRAALHAPPRRHKPCLVRAITRATTRLTTEQTQRRRARTSPQNPFGSMGRAQNSLPHPHTTKLDSLRRPPTRAETKPRTPTRTTFQAAPLQRLRMPYLTQITYPNTGTAHIEKYGYAYSSGKLTSSIDQNNLTTTYMYNDSLARLTETDFPDGGVTTIAYNDS